MEKKINVLVMKEIIEKILIKKKKKNLKNWKN